MKKFKYECRPCPPHIRTQCIREANLSPAVKLIIARAFDSKTDTEDTWSALQPNCLLVRLEQVPVVSPTGTGPRKGGLWERLHAQKEAPSEPEATLEEPSPPVVSPPVVQPRPAKTPEAPSQRQTTSQTRFTHLEQPVVSDAESLTTRVSVGLSPPRRLGDELAYPEVMPPRLAEDGILKPCMLVSLFNGHRILLPEDGELILGRFDPLAGIKPDVDLSFEDQAGMTISRRHARVLGWHSRYAIEDLGSSNGTWINNKRLETGQKHPLKIGDMVRLGRCVFLVNEWPEIWQIPAPEGRYFLYATFTGHFFSLKTHGENVIGRADPDLGFYPDVDLSGEPGVEAIISRRHAKLSAQRGRFVVQDLGSTYGTRIDGHQLTLGVEMTIRPGQHLWLGGYTLAFDVI